MPFALVTIGLLMIITGINNTYAQFGTQVASDFTGPKSFVVWVVAIGAVGALGYVNDLRQFSHYFMALILISLVLSNKGVFQNFQAALAAGPTTPKSSSTSVSQSSSPATVGDAIQQHESGAFGQSPQNQGQAFFNGWFNYLFGMGPQVSGNAQ